VTERGLRSNVRVGILYIESWLRGVGAAALFNLMEDAATAEISRSQVWQWVAQGVQLEEGGIVVSRDLVQGIVREEIASIREAIGEDVYVSGRFEEASELFARVALSDTFEDFLTIPAYEHLP
jgi:malate synthase